jgi:hypothetical protein
MGILKVHVFLGFTISVNVKPLVGAGEEGKELRRPNKGAPGGSV